ncbi:fumarylacetoacetase [Paraburkholderia tropica]|uniref:fumarylacetoacetase n=1 Tax=Paraburkholderia tropica TaxID=92647 RepID=UPI002AB714B8|nr:fumarylacetoacetase [Paraburkholderia tropica]
MSRQINATHDPALQSWVASANLDKADFPIQNLPFGVFNYGERQACGVAIGDFVLDVAQCTEHFTGDGKRVAQACGASSMNDVMKQGNPALCDFRAQLSRLLRDGNVQGRAALESALISRRACEMQLPVSIGGYTDFFASIHHATNAGSLFRPDTPLLPNYKYVPIAYNGRANSVQVGGARVQRPHGQTRAPEAEAPSFGPSARLDYEVELGAYIGSPTARGEPLLVADAAEHVFGYSLLNDWSARDIQAWEYQPLGPFLAKSFATSVSPWILTADALAPFRLNAFNRPEGDPKPLPYLQDAQDAELGGLAVTIEASLRTRSMQGKGLPAYRLSISNSRDLYWTFAQMLTHHTSNGSCLDTGDLIGSGTISGAHKQALGSLLEITRGGREPITLPNGEQRTWLEDGDEITLSGYCVRDGYRRIGFGSCTGVIVAASPQRN